jgi:acyl carrier protein
VLDINWNKMMHHMMAIGKSPIFSDFCTTTDDQSTSNDFKKQLLALEEPNRLPFITVTLKEMIGKTLKMDPILLDETTRLNLLGVDSLMAMELHTLMEINLDMRIPSMELMKGPTIRHLTLLIMREASK